MTACKRFPNDGSAAVFCVFHVRYWSESLFISGPIIYEGEPVAPGMMDFGSSAPPHPHPFELISSQGAESSKDNLSRADTAP